MAMTFICCFDLTQVSDAQNDELLRVSASLDRFWRNGSMSLDQLRELVRRSRRPKRQLKRLAMLVKFQELKKVLTELSNENRNGQADTNSDSESEDEINRTNNNNNNSSKAICLQALGADLTHFFI